ncbi:MAG TPA: helix-turn-helix domain-containing protein [Nitrosospira sp.]|nr:helix-turn-helix domain-containing protein [Nitrosospira sp.]
MSKVSKWATVAEVPASIPQDCRNCGAYKLCMSLWLKSGDASLLDRVVKRKQVLKRGETLYRMGQSVEYLYVIRGGSVKTCITTEDGQVQIIGFHIAGELLGLEDMETREHNCEARATGLTSVCEVSIDRFEELTRKDSAIQYEIFKILSMEVRHAQELALLLGKHNAEERLAAFLLSLSKQFSERHCSANEFDLSMSRGDIGNYLGIAEETVCRVFARFQHSGLISSDCRHVKLNDLERLQQLAHHRVPHHRLPEGSRSADMGRPMLLAATKA